jgi:hypothetical protein
MPKAGDKLVYKLGRSLVQLWDLSALSTNELRGPASRSLLYRFKHTAGPQLRSGFAQSDLSISSLLFNFLYPVSTAPITNTNYIKGL